MAQASSLPFLTAAETDVNAGEWHHLDLHGDPVRVGEHIPGWDYQLDVDFLRAISIDGVSFKEACRLPSDAVLKCCVIAQSRPGRFRERVWEKRIPPDGLHETIQFTSRGTELAGELTLLTQVVLAEELPDSRPLVAHLAGSLLWEHSFACRLEGDASRFPVEVIDFEQRLPNIVSPDALWYFDFSLNDLEASATGELRIYLNSRHESLVEAAGRADPLLSSTLQIEIARRLISAALDEPEFTEVSESFPDGTLGQAIARLFTVSFPHMSVAEVGGLRVSHPARFESMIQSGAVLHHGD